MPQSQPLPVLLSLIFALTLTRAFIQYPPELEAQIDQYPKLRDARSQCLPTRGNYEPAENFVCDPSAILTVNEINMLNQRLQQFRIRSESEKSCDPNNPHPTIAVALIDKMKVGLNESPDRLLGYAVQFAYRLFHKWSMPSNCPKETDRMIIFLSKEDGVVYTLAGDLMKRKLPSKSIIDITVKSRSPFANSVAEGLSFLIQAYKEKLSS